MHSLVAINPQKKDSFEFENLGTVEFGQVKILFGKIELEQPEFEPNDEKNKDKVLLKVRAFSCNYRDKSLLLVNYLKAVELGRLFVAFGSEFVADVVAVGENVSEFKVGDKVMSNCAYPDSGEEGLLPGVATNFASLGWLRIHRKKLIKVPNSLSDSEAACFSLGSQTASGMIQRSGILDDGKNALVLSARSATSLFVIQQLISYGIKPLCLTTSDWTDEEKQKVYPACVVKLDENVSYEEIQSRKIMHVFDPFYDMNMEYAIKYLQVGGNYITCGLRDQHQFLSIETPESTGVSIRRAIVNSVIKNVSIIGNCLGTKQDLEKAIMLHNEYGICPIIDTEYTLDKGKEFVEYTFFSKNKFGKCALIYDND